MKTWWSVDWVPVLFGVQCVTGYSARLKIEHPRTAWVCIPLLSSVSMGDVKKVGLLYAHLHSVHPY